jgi:hypothetical protein
LWTKLVVEPGPISFQYLAITILFSAPCELFERLFHLLNVIACPTVAPNGRLDVVQVLQRVEGQLQRIDVPIHRLPRFGLLQKTMPRLALAKALGSV